MRNGILFTLKRPDQSLYLSNTQIRKSLDSRAMASVISLKTTVFSSFC